MAHLKTTAMSIALTVAALSAGIGPSFAGVDDSDQQREQRWQDLSKQIFDGKTATPDESAIKLDAPVEDAGEIVEDDAELVEVA